jgi:anion-transporting  ArsA/GET3 family ATPase
LVTRYARDETQRSRILENRFYQNIAGALSGTQEYMAMEKLHALAESNDYDLIVVDTPPTRHALAFLDAPRMLTRLLENRVYRLLMAPRGFVRAVNSAAQVFIHQITRVVGAEVVDDAIAFFRAFEGMEQGFAERAKTMIELLRSDETAFVLVAAPRADTVVETKYFVGQLEASQIKVRACVVNRMAPLFAAVRSKSTKTLPHRAAVDQLREAAVVEEAHVTSLIDGLGDIAIARVPLLASDLHDLDGIASMERLLFG